VRATQVGPKPILFLNGHLGRISRCLFKERKVKRISKKKGGTSGKDLPTFSFLQKGAGSDVGFAEVNQVVFV